MLDLNEMYYEILAARRRIAPLVKQTPLILSSRLSSITGARVFLKCENLQVSGSFKIRGAANTILGASQSGSMVVASTGNHAAACAAVLARLGKRGIFFIPEDISIAKRRKLDSIGGKVVSAGSDCAETEALARAYALRHNKLFVSPYNDKSVIAGQGTVGQEVLARLSPDVILVPVGGGGLISGISLAVKRRHPRIRIIGCQPANSPVMARSVAAGQIIQMKSEPTLSDGTAGGIEPEALTFEVCRRLVDDYITLTEAEIREAMREIIFSEQMLIEGSAALSVAALIKMKNEFRGKTLALILSGSTVSEEDIRKIVG